MSEGLLLIERDIGACAAGRTKLGGAKILQEPIDTGAVAGRALRTLADGRDL